MGKEFTEFHALLRKQDPETIDKAVEAMERTRQHPLTTKLGC